MACSEHFCLLQLLILLASTIQQIVGNPIGHQPSLGFTEDFHQKEKTSLISPEESSSLSDMDAGIPTQTKRPLIEERATVRIRTKRGVLNNYHSLKFTDEENEKHKPCEEQRRVRFTNKNQSFYIENICKQTASISDKIPNRNFVCVNVQHTFKIKDETVDVGVSCELRCKGHECAPYYQL